MWADPPTDPSQGFLAGSVLLNGGSGSLFLLCSCLSLIKHRENLSSIECPMLTIKILKSLNSNELCLGVVMMELVNVNIIGFRPH